MPGPRSASATGWRWGRCSAMWATRGTPKGRRPTCTTGSTSGGRPRTPIPCWSMTSDGLCCARHNLLAHLPDLLGAGTAPDAVLPPLLDDARGVAHRGHQLPREVEDVGPAAVAHHHQGLAAGVVEEVLRRGAGEVGQGHAGGAVPLGVALLAVAGAALLAPTVLLQPPGHGIGQAPDPLLDPPRPRAGGAIHLPPHPPHHPPGPVAGPAPRGLADLFVEARPPP